MKEDRELIKRIHHHLSDDLLHPRFQKSGPHPTTGHCYVACEVYRHLSGLTLHPHVIPGTVHGVTHWFLRDIDGDVHDPTREQFPFSVRYHLGRRCGFLTKDLSKRARELIRRISD